MIHFENIINAIRDNNGFKSNKHEDSYYRLYNTSKGPIQVRISNHGTELWTWVKNAPIDPSECYANICIVLSDDGTHHSNTTADMNIYQKDENGKNILDHDGKRIPVGRLDDFEVIQYVYNLSILSNRNVGIINQMIQQIPIKGGYYEPLQTNPQKHAKVFKLIPNKPEEIIKENTDTNMKTNNKNVVRLTESKLTQIVAESVRKVLNEMQNDDFSMKCLNYLEQNEYSKESLSKVANLMFKNDRWTLYDGRHELLALATDQNGKLMYSFNQKAWQYVN